MDSDVIFKLPNTNLTDPFSRVTELIEKRIAAATAAGEEERRAFPHETNGDEERYADQAYAGNFSKTLPHDSKTGLVDPVAYQALLNALRTGTLESFDLVPRGGPGRLAGPLSPLMFQMEGRILPAPSLRSCRHRLPVPAGLPRWSRSTGKPIFAMFPSSIMTGILWSRRLWRT
jgi:hypothetical protein